MYVAKMDDLFGHLAQYRLQTQHVCLMQQRPGPQDVRHKEQPEGFALFLVFTFREDLLKEKGHIGFGKPWHKPLARFLGQGTPVGHLRWEAGITQTYIGQDKLHQPFWHAVSGGGHRMQQRRTNSRVKIL